MLSREGRPLRWGMRSRTTGGSPRPCTSCAWPTSPATGGRSRPRPTSKEGRHALARKIFHGRSGQLYQNYHEGMEDQIGALGLVLNALVVFTTRYMNAALDQLRADGQEVLEEDVARLSPFVRHHINMLGRYSFALPEIPGGPRPLRGRTGPEDE
ncbi:Tn3 family transposase [Streptomyces sp900116325]|uniref:Tn3 family transposase n=1 Tax=Streptomyces sp. 900116325 TaxID=3154295 RepID=A0ABV2UKK2_9ACTN